MSKILTMKFETTEIIRQLQRFFLIIKKAQLAEKSQRSRRCKFTFKNIIFFNVPIIMTGSYIIGFPKCMMSSTMKNVNFILQHDHFVCFNQTLKFQKIFIFHLNVEYLLTLENKTPTFQIVVWLFLIFLANGYISGYWEKICYLVVFAKLCEYMFLKIIV